jgi:hypothetical protein
VPAGASVARPTVAGAPRPEATVAANASQAAAQIPIECYEGLQFAWAPVRDSRNNSATMINNRSSFARAAATATLLVVSPIAIAVLGGDEASIQGDSIHLKGAISVQQTVRFAVHEIVQPSGTSVRQYVSPAGTVFAVAWQGPLMPDLRQLLGPYFDSYVAAAKAKRAKRTPVVIRGASLVVLSGGHLRAFSGRAYVPDLVPQDVDAEVLQ